MKYILFSYFYIEIILELILLNEELVIGHIYKNYPYSQKQQSLFISTHHVHNSIKKY